MQTLLVTPEGTLTAAKPIIKYIGSEKPAVIEQCYYPYSQEYVNYRWPFEPLSDNEYTVAIFHIKYKQP